MFRVSTLVVLSALLSACISLEPKYERPAAPVAETWPTGAAYATVSETEVAAADIPWASYFKDEKLRQVIDQALNNSRNLRQTVANIESARALYRVQRASLLPSFSADVSGTKGRSVIGTSDSSGKLTTT